MTLRSNRDRSFGVSWMKSSAFDGSLCADGEREIQCEEGEREQALRRVKKRRDLQAQAVSYLVINTALWAIWSAVGTGYPWPAWFTGAWTIGLLLSAWDLYLRRPITDADVQCEMERLRAQARRSINPWPSRGGSPPSKRPAFNTVSPR